MKRHISIVMAIVFFITMLPLNTMVQASTNSLMSQIQSFNEKSGIATHDNNENETNEDVISDEKHIPALNTVLGDNETVLTVNPQDAFDYQNTEDEIIKTIPVEDETSDEVLDKQLEEKRIMMKERAKAKQSIEEFKKMPDGFDWYVETFGEENDEIYEPDVYEEAYEETVTDIYEADLSGDNDETLDESLAEDEETVSDIEEALEESDIDSIEETLADAEIDAEDEVLAEAENYAQDEVLAEAETIDMLSMQNSVTILSGAAGSTGVGGNSSAVVPVSRTISGTVTIPVGMQTASGNRLQVNIYEAPYIVDGRVVKEATIYKRMTKNLELYESQVSFSTTVPSGEYIVSTKFLSSDPYILNSEYFYSANGVILNANIAEVINVDRDIANINITIPQAERYISGTLDFSNCIPYENTYVRIRAYGNDDFYSNYTAQLYVPAGTSTINYAIALPQGAYRINVYGDFFEGGDYYNGTLSNNYRDRTIINVENNVTGLNISVPEYTDDDGSTGDWDYDEYTVTLKLSDTFDEIKEYAVALIWDDGLYAEIYDMYSMQIGPGVDEITFDFYVDADLDGNLYAAYKDITVDGSWNYGELEEQPFMYYSDTLDVVPDMKDATDIKGNFNIVINEPDFVTVEGSVSVDCDVELTGCAFVGAEFKDGIFAIGVDLVDKEYSLRIPQRYVGEEFEMFFAPNKNGLILYDSIIYNDEIYTLEEYQTIDVSAGEFTTLSGNIYLPCEAPLNGANITLDMYSSTQNYVLMPGEDSVKYKFPVMRDMVASDNGYKNAYLAVFEPINSMSYIYGYDSNLYFEEAVTVSGTVSLPDGLTFDKDITFDVEVRGKSGSNYTTCSILAGQSQTKYSIKHPCGATITEIFVDYGNKDVQLAEYSYIHGSSITEDMVHNINLGLAKTISGTVSLPSDADYDGGRVDLEVVVYSFDGSYRNGKYYGDVDPKDGLEYSINVPDNEEMTYRVGVYVNYIDSDDETCIECYQYAYYVDDYEMTRYEAEAAYVAGDSVCNMYFPLKKTISGKVKFTSDAFATGELRSNISVENEYGEREYSNITISDISKGFDYKIYIPSYWNNAKIDIGIYQNDANGTSADFEDNYVPIKSNISFTNYSYNEIDGFVGGNSITSTMIPVNDGLVLPDFTVPKATKVTGRVTVPNDFMVDGTLEYIDLQFEKTGGSTGYDSAWATGFVDSSKNFEAYIPSYANGEYIVSSYKPYNVNTNILDGMYYYSDDEGIAIPVNVTSGQDVTGIEIKYETGYVIQGTVSLPSDAQIGEKTYINVNVRHADANSVVRLSAQAKSGRYMIAVPKDNPMVDKLYFMVDAYGKDNTISTNIFQDEFYYGTNGTLITDYNSAEDITVTSNITKDATLITGISVPVTINRPRDSHDYLNGEIMLEYISESSTATDGMYFYKSQYFNIDYDADSCITSIVIPKELCGKEFYLSYRVYGGDVYSNGNVWINKDGSYSKHLQEADTYKIENGTSFDITLGTYEQLAKKIKGTISFEEDCALAPNTTYTLYVHAENIYNGVTSGTNIYVNSVKDYDYSITLSDYYTGDYRVYAELYSNGTNVCNEYVYYTTNGITTNRNEASAVAEDSINIDIEIPKLTQISGKVVVDEDYQCIEPLSQINVVYRDSSYNERGNVVNVDENMNWTAYLPYSFEGTCQIGLRVPEGEKNNLVKDYTYWTENWISVEHGEDVENINIAVETGYTISGTIKLPEGIELDEDESIIYTLGLGNNYTHYIFDSENTELDFIFGVEKDNYTWSTFTGYGDCETDNPVNVFTGNVYYDAEGNVSYNNYSSFSINSDIENIELSIPEGILMNVEFSGLSNQYISGEIGVSDIESDSSYSYSYYSGGGNYNVWYVIPETFSDKIVLISYNNINSDNEYCIPWDVYLNRDGKFYADEEAASAYVLDKENSFAITVPKAADVVYPEAYLQSEHPYANYLDKTYTYTHPEEADSLKITFSGNTYVNYDDYIYVLDGNGNQIGSGYTYSNLAGMSITVPGNKFSVRLTTNSYDRGFGFAVTEVEAVVSHTVTFKNYDGTVLETIEVIDGENAVYAGSEPVKEADGLTNYRFIGWDKDTYCITEDTVFTALFEEVVIYMQTPHPYTSRMNETYTYTYPEEVDALRITFSNKTETEANFDKIIVYNEDGTPVSTYSGTQLKGKSVTVNGNSFKIVFTSDGSVEKYGFEVVGIAPVKDFYTVTFKNYDGTVLETKQVPAGGTATYTGQTPVRESTSGIYRFTGWNKTLTQVYQDLVVTAQFDYVYYVTVNYYNYDGTLLYTDSVLRGDSSQYEGAVPFKPMDDNGIGYVFTGWDKDLYSIYGNTSVYAQFARRTVKKISTEAQLREIHEDPDGVYVLENDITLTSPWEAVGLYSDGFSGVFDGNGYSIKNVTFLFASADMLGLFGLANNAVLRNINLEVNVESAEYRSDYIISPLVVTAINCDIRNVHTKGYIKIDSGINNTVSGFIDQIESSYVDGCSANVDITASGVVSGFAGNINNSNISNCFYNGEIKPGSNREYIVGFADVSVDEETVIETSYSNATLDLSNNGSIMLSAPFVNLPSSVVENGLTVRNSYYNKDTFTLDAYDYYDDEVTSLGTGLTDEEMKNQNSFVDFDFEMIWEIGEDGYPVLSATGGKICDEHSFSEWEKVSEESCAEDGVYTRTCSRCSRVEKRYVAAFGHSFSEWVTVKEADVLSEGLKTRECSSCNTVETEEISKLQIDINDPNYGLVHFDIVDAVTLEPISNAQIFISTDNDGENTFYTDDEGRVSQYLPIGIVNVSVYKSGYLTRTIKIDVVSGEQSVPAIGISTKPLVEAKLSSKVMSYDEIIEAGIDVTAPGNNHVVKYNVTLTFGGKESTNIVTYFNENHSCVGNTRIPVHISTGTVYVYPVSENFYLMVYGEVQWLKEMFDVEMLIVNNSNTDTVTECTAELTLPEGLSLAEMVGEQQTLIQKVDDIDHSQSKSVHWYVRGDVAGEYYISAKLNAVLQPFEEIINQQYTLEEPIVVYAGNAMHMDIYVPDMTFYGDNYPIRIELTNVSDRTLYNVSNSIKYFKEGKVTYYSNGVAINQEYFTEDTIAKIGASEFKPGDKISLEVQADIEFRSSLIRAGIDEIKKYVDNIDELLKAYEAYISGAKAVNDTYVSVNAMRENLTKIIAEKSYTGDDKVTADELLSALSDFAQIVKEAESQKANELLNKLKTTGVYGFISKVCESGDVFKNYRANRVNKFISTINAIVKSEQSALQNSSDEEMLFELLRRAIESIPVKYYLEDALVSTLDGSTTTIPYTIHRVTSDERFSSIARLDGYLCSVIETAFGHIDEPWIMDILKGENASYNDTEDVIFVNGKVNKFAAADNIGDVEFKAWTSADSSDVEITCTNENATLDNGVLSFVGSGYISVKALEAGSGTLYIQNGSEISEYHYTVVDEHICEASNPVTIISPDANTKGYTVSFCNICSSIMTVGQHKDACENHVYGEYTVELDSEGDELGIKHRVCSECGHIQYLVVDETINYMDFILTPESRLNIVEKTTEEGDYLKQVAAGMSSDQIKSHFDNTNIEVIRADGTTIEASSKVGTGSKLVISSDGETQEAELTIIVKGDTTGEGDLNLFDMVGLFNHIAEDENNMLEGDFKEAAYINDDSEINIFDLVLMFNAIMNEEVLK